MHSRSLFLPLVLIVLGSLWFLKSTNLMPDTSAIVAIALAVFGFMVMMLDGFNKQSIVAGPLLIYIGAAIHMYYQEDFRLSPLFAAGMIFLGLLLLLSRSNAIPDKYARPKLPPQD